MHMSTKRMLLNLGAVAGLTFAAQAADIKKTWVETDAASPTGPYLVIDLTSSKIAVEKQSDPERPPKTMEGFVVRNLDAAPAGGWTDEYKTTKMVLRRIPAGTFKMGSPADELGRDADEPQHAVTLTKDFYIGVFEVTMKQWELVTGKAVSGHTRCNISLRNFQEERANVRELDCRPVEMITFYEIRENPMTDREVARAILAKQAPAPEPKQPPAPDPKKGGADKKAAAGKRPGAGAGPEGEAEDDLPGATPSELADQQREARQKGKQAAVNALEAIMERPSDDPNVDWPANNAVNPNSFFGKLRAKTMLTGLDLPTEAQWEYACRAGTTTALNSGKNLTQWAECPNMTELGRYMANHDPSEWFWSKRWDRLWSAVVGSYAPNPWGLYDMHGNVWEWCLDWYGPLSAEAATDPKGPVTGQTRVVRGGGWDDRAKACRSANRGPAGDPEGKNPFFGFRVTLSLP